MKTQKEESNEPSLYTYEAFYLGDGKIGTITKKDAAYVSSLSFSMRK
jgi:hypothetical protein